MSSRTLFPLEITFAKPQLAKLLADSSRMRQKYGATAATNIPIRIGAIRDAKNLETMVRLGNLHPLRHKDHGKFAVSVDRQRRLVFAPDHDPVPTLADGGIDRRRVTRVTILQITDYH